MFEGAWNDIRFALRLLRRAPGFAAVAVLSLALGIGATTAIFTVLDAVVLKGLPVPDPTELYVAEVRQGSDRSPRFSYPLVESARAAVAGHAEIAAFSSVARMLLTDGPQSVPSPAEMGRVQLVSGEFFTVMRQSAQVGRLFTPGDNRAVNAHPVAVLSDAYWERRFARDRAVLSRPLYVNGVAFTILGVAPRGFIGIVADSPPDVWAPIMMQAAVRYSGNASSEDGADDQPWPPQREISWLSIVARISSAPAVARTAQQLHALVQQDFSNRPSYRSDPEARRRYQAARLVLEPASRGVSRARERLSSPLVALFVMVTLLLLIACANLASLLLARAAARRRELAVRVSMGAGRWRIVRQMLAESLLVAGAGGAFGLLFASWGADLLLLFFAGSQGPPTLPMGLDWRVLTFAMTTSLVTGLLFGLLPALRASRVDPADALNGAARALGGSDGGRLPLGRMLIAAQLAITVLLLSVALLFSRTFEQLATVDTGYDVDHVIAASIDPRAAAYDGQRLDVVQRALVERLGVTPGVASASLSQNGPLASSQRLTVVSVDGYQPAAGERMIVSEEVVTDPYFRTVGLRLLKGRFFGPGDRAGGRVSIINETMARRYFGTADPIGRQWSYGTGEEDEERYEIVGVVSDARIRDLRGEPPRTIYRPFAQAEGVLESVEVRTVGTAAGAVADVRNAIASVDPRLPVLEIAPLASRVDRMTAQERMVAALSSAFGASALLLACLGLYGTLAYNVTRRTPELGLRVALGAGRGRLIWLVMRDALIVVAVGLCVGLPLALAGANQASSLLYGVAPGDLTSHAGAVLVLIAVAAIAAWLPARRAASVDPMIALRAE